MQSKILLTEQSIVYGEIPSILKDKLDLDRIKTDIIKNYALNNFQSKDIFNYHKDYLDIDYLQHITWIHDYLIDDYRLHHEKTLVQTDSFGIVLFPNESIDYHHQVDDYDIHNSNDISCIYVLEAEEKSSAIMFEYEQGRKRHQQYRVQLKEKQLIIFNSELRHCFTKNFNSGPTVNLSLKYQLI